MTRSSLSQRIAWAIAILVFTACGDSVQDPDVTPEPEPQAPPTQIVAISADSFSGVVGTQLAEPLRVRVTDAGGQGVSGVAVDFRVTSGFGTITVPAAGGLGLVTGGSVQALVADSTDANGEAEARWTLGTGAGTQTARALVNNVGTVTFTAIAGPDVPASWEFTAETAFIGIAGQSADGPIEVGVLDQFNNSVPGVGVSWSALSGGGTVATAMSTTDSAGNASVDITLGPDHGVHLFSAAPSGFTPDTVAILAVVGASDPTDAADPGGAGLVAHDVTFFGGTIVDSVLVLYFRFAADVAPLPTGAEVPSNSIVGWVDLDTDQDSTTGFQISRECFGFGDPLGIGVEVFFDLNPASANLAPIPNPPAGAIPVMRLDSVAQGDPCAGTVFITAIVPIYRDNTLLLFASTDFIEEDDGMFDFTSFVANGATFAVTDIVPDSLAHTFDLGPITAFGSGTARRATGTMGYLRYLTRSLERTAPIRVRRTLGGRPAFRRP